MSNIYMSLNTSGVDTKEFYKKAGCTIQSVSQETGISRAALTGVPVHKCSARVAEKALKSMEKANRTRYIERVKNLRHELEEVWKQYQDIDYAMIAYRKEYEIKRKYPRLQKVSLSEMPLKNKV